MPIRTGRAVWKGTLQNGEGTVQTETGVLDARYSFSSRFESGTGTNPEELLGAAHAGCFSMAFASGLEKAGFTVERISTEDRVHIEKVEDSFTITKIETTTECDVPGMDDETFQRLAEDAKKNCPVSRALKAVQIDLVARLKGSSSPAE
ncbi:MAG: OsmC family protein [Fidelibacterota bacterium]